MVFASSSIDRANADRLAFVAQHINLDSLML